MIRTLKDGVVGTLAVISSTDRLDGLVLDEQRGLLYFSVRVLCTPCLFIVEQSSACPLS